MTGARSRRKGHDFEREFCRWVREHLGDKIKEFGRNLKQSYCAQEGDTDPLAGFLPECKSYSSQRQARAYKREAWQQACAAAKKRGLEPLVIWKIPGGRGDCKFIALMRDPVHGDADWSWGFEWRKEVEPAAFAAIVRERL